MAGYTVRMWRRSLVVLLAMVVLGFGTSVYRLVKLQLIDGEELHQRAISQQLKDTKLHAKRGTIYDCNMKPLAESATVWTVVLEPAYLKEDKIRAEVADGLSGILGIDRDELYEKTKEKSYYTIIKRKVELDVRDQVLKFKKEHNLDSGIRLIEDYKRYYPYGSFASSVIGVTGSDSQGLFGLENFYDKILTGEAGRLVTAKNALGTELPFDYEQRIDARNGYSLVLSIDEIIQHTLEKSLEEGIIKHKVANRAVAIMMDVKTGEILGMAVKGDFDLNSPFEIIDPKARQEIESLPEEERAKARSEALEAQWRNKAVSDIYYPGSVFKMITLSMGFEEGIVSEDTHFNCTGSIVPIQGARPISCWRSGGHGDQTYIQALCNSCNPAFIALGQKLGTDTFYKYFSAFGLTKKTGIDLPGESEGLFFSRDGSMSATDLAVASMGQNFSITPIQMITAAAAVANGGKLVQPHIVKQVIDDDGNIIKSNEAMVRKQVISESTSKRVSQILFENATIGTGKNGYVPGFRVCGKTGTSEKVGCKSISGGMDHIASYCGFAPVEDPQVALLVYYDTPLGDVHSGAFVAAPSFASIMGDVLPYLGVERKYTDKEMSELNTSVPFVTGLDVGKARQELLELSLSPVIRGQGATVVAQVPDAYASIPKGGRVVLYTDDNREQIVVPKFIGLSMSGANREALKSGLNIKLEGDITSGKTIQVVSQSIPEGEKVLPGTVITLSFAAKAE